MLISTMQCWEDNVGGWKLGMSWQLVSSHNWPLQQNAGVRFAIYFDLFSSNFGHNNINT